MPIVCLFEFEENLQVQIARKWTKPETGKKPI